MAAQRVLKVQLPVRFVKICLLHPMYSVDGSLRDVGRTESKHTAVSPAKNAMRVKPFEDKSRPLPSVGGRMCVQPATVVILLGGAVSHDVQSKISTVGPRKSKQKGSITEKGCTQPLRP